MSIQKKTRRDSYRQIHPKIRSRQLVILSILQDCGPLSAQEVANELHRCCYTLSDERNLAAPRLTELARTGEVIATGKKICTRTKRSVTVWAARKEGNPGVQPEDEPC